MNTGLWEGFEEESWKLDVLDVLDDGRGRGTVVYGGVLEPGVVIDRASLLNLCSRSSVSSGQRIVCQ